METTLSKCEGLIACDICDDYREIYYVAARGTSKKKVCEDCRDIVVKMKPSGTYSAKGSQGLFCQVCTRVGPVLVAIDQDEVVSNSLCQKCLKTWVEQHEW